MSIDSTVEQVGTVEVLTARIYPIDPNMGDNREATTVVVEPGVYPVYRDLDAYYWMMSGRINGRGFWKIGDGMFEMNAGDSRRGPEVTFPSKVFGVERFREFLAEPVCMDDDPQQRLRFELPDFAEDRS